MTFRMLATLLASALAAGPLVAATASARSPLPDAPAVGPPVAHEGLAIYLLSGRSAEGPVPLTLQEALAKGTIVVHETGSVQELRIENTGSEAVFVQMGDIVKGGRQDRVLTVSLLLSPKSGSIPIGAYCVERGRWAPRGGEDVRRFALSEALLPSRAAKVAIARPAPSADMSAGVSALGARTLERAPRSPIEAELEQRRLRVTEEQRSRTEPGPRPAQRTLDARDGGRGGGGQAEVWRNVDVIQRRLSESLAASVASDRSRTSLQLSLENEKLREAVEAYVKALEPKGLDGTDVVGVAVAIDGKIASADVYPSNGLFRKMWPKLLRAAATEAIALKAKDARSTSATAIAAGVAAPPSVAAVEAFLAEASAGPTEERFVGSVGRIETLEARTALKVRARLGAAAGSRLVHESYLAK